jgi:hypothetical protein
MPLNHSWGKAARKAMTLWGNFLLANQGLVVDGALSCFPHGAENFVVVTSLELEILSGHCSNLLRGRDDATL